MKLARIGLDGSKIKGNSSKDKAMSFGRMKEKEDHLRKEVRARRRDADRIETREDELYGRERGLDDLPQELRHLPLA